MTNQTLTNRPTTLREIYELLAEAEINQRTATTYDERRRLKEAMREVRHRLTKLEAAPTPPPAQVLALQAQLYLALNRPEATLTGCVEALEADPTEALAYYILAYYYIKQKNYRAALKELDQAISLDRADPDFWGLRLVVYSYLKDENRTIQDAEQALTIDPNNSRAWWGRAQHALKQKKWQASLTAYNEALKSDPTNAVALVERSACHLSLKAYGDALSDLNRAIELDPGKGLYYLVRANVQRRLKNQQAWLSDANRAFELEPENPLYLIGCSNAHFGLRLYEEALADSERARALKPGQWQDAYITRLVVQPLSRFEDVWRSEWKPVLLVWLAYTLIAILRLPIFTARYLQFLPSQADNLTISSVIGFGLVTALLFRSSRLKARDVGLGRAGLLRGIGAALILWGVIQLTGFAIAPEAALNPALGRLSSFGWLLNLLLGHYLPIAFVQEVVFRGFLLPQLYFKLGLGKWRLPQALIISQTMFALSQLLYSWYWTPDQPIGWVQFGPQFVQGLASGLVYLRTRNLYFVIAIHTLLIGLPTSNLFETGLSTDRTLIFLTLLATIVWPIPVGRPPTPPDQEGSFTAWLGWPWKVRLAAMVGLLGWVWLERTYPADSTGWLLWWLGVPLWLWLAWSLRSEVRQRLGRWRSGRKT